MQLIQIVPGALNEVFAFALKCKTTRSLSLSLAFGPVFWPESKESPDPAEWNGPAATL